MANEPNGNGQEKSLVLQRMDSLRTAITDDFVQSQLKAAMGENAQSFAASIIDIFSMDKYLQECDPKLVIVQALKAAVLKLPISKSLGFAWVIAYNKIPQFQIGYKGLIQLAIRTSMYKYLHTDVVFEGEYRSTDKLTGTFDLNGQRKSDVVIGYFAHFELLNGFSKTLYMTKENVTVHAKRYSKSWGKPGSGWATHFDEMGKKTTIRGLLTHWGYLSVEMVAAMDEDPDYDAQDRVIDEIKGKGNTQGMGFTDYEITGDKNGQGDPGPGATADPGTTGGDSENRKAPF